ncbi:hypothetical protein Hanom_Chr00s000001g01594101 [Helianthus anomalus]
MQLQVVDKYGSLNISGVNWVINIKIQLKLCTFDIKITLKIITSRLKCYRLVHFVVGLADCASQCNELAYLVTLRTQNFNRGMIFRIVYRSLVIYIRK